MTTTDPLKKLTLQNLTNITFKMNIYNEEFIDYSSMFENA